MKVKVIKPGLTYGMVGIAEYNFYTGEYTVKFSSLMTVTYNHSQVVVIQ